MFLLTPLYKTKGSPIEIERQSSMNLGIDVGAGKTGGRLGMCIEQLAMGLWVRENCLPEGEDA